MPAKVGFSWPTTPDQPSPLGRASRPHLPASDVGWHLAPKPPRISEPRTATPPFSSTLACDGNLRKHFVEVSSKRAEEILADTGRLKPEQVILVLNRGSEILRRLGTRNSRR